MVSSIVFVLALAAGIFLFSKRVRTIRRNILLGRDVVINDQKALRWKTMLRVAFGQSKMGTRPVAAILHFILYAGFVIINIEVLEIVIDGIFGTHRVFSVLGPFYDFLIGSFEILAFLVLVACVILLMRRNVLRLKRFHMREMTSWPKSDANIILIAEILLMFAFLSMNSCDYLLQQIVIVPGIEHAETLSHYVKAGSYPISSQLTSLYTGNGIGGLIMIERGMWWFHILGILTFLVYITYSKHFHILLAFPNTYYSNLNPLGRFNNLESVKKEVELMMDPSADPYASPPSQAEAAGEVPGQAESAGEVPGPFGAKDVKDLSWKQLMDSYTCTECGRCTSECPANQTGKLLSPRKIVMDTRDRLEEVGKNIDKNGEFKDDGKSLLRDYISEEELWACTSCNACTEACPINIDPLGIIVDLRRYLIMEESKSPEAITSMFTNIENNGAPWAFPAMDRANWKDEVND